MKKYIFFCLVSLIVVGGAKRVGADELTFPTNEKEFVEALSLQDEDSVHNDLNKVSLNKKNYKRINSKKVRVRGLALVTKTPLTPRAGALVNFDHDSARIKDSSFSLLNEFGKALTGALKNAVLTVSGHTDSVGDDEYNQNLSQQRAKSVACYLMKKFAIAKHRLRIEAYGETVPIASNNTEDGRAINRRVEFTRVNG